MNKDIDLEQRVSEFLQTKSSAFAGSTGSKKTHGDFLSRVDLVTLTFDLPLSHSLQILNCSRSNPPIQGQYSAAKSKLAGNAETFKADKRDMSSHAGEVLFLRSLRCNQCEVWNLFIYIHFL